MSTRGDVPDSTVDIPKHPSMDSLQELTKTSKQKVRSPAPSVSSHRSCASSVRLQQKLAAETAKKRLEFLEEESKLLEEKAAYEANAILQKAKLDAAERRLSAKKEAAIAVAQLQAVEEDEDLDFPYELTESDSVTQERTAEYVRNQEPIVPPQEDLEHKPKPNNKIRSERIETNNSQCVATDLAKYLVKRDLLTARFHKFDDKSEHYVSWKCTFQSVTREIEATPAEELDLLLRWTGEESSKQVQSLKVANAGKPVTALERAWKRLDSRYGSPEKVEVALKKKLNSVPKMTVKDRGKMYELSDILSEISAVKERPEYAGLLSFYDTSMGINPTVTKLPPNLQNKWRDRAAMYKRIHSVLFPPFTYFCDFVHDMAEVFNDPSFDFDINTNTYSHGPPVRNTRVSVAKTTVGSTNGTEDDRVLCIIHKTNHTLDECRVFRHKPFEERKTLLKQNGICFRCCAAKHLRRNCHAKIRCSECGEMTHATAMHIFRTSPAFETSQPFQVASTHGGEHRTEVSSSCTEICKGGPAKSCAKIVLVTLSHKDSVKIRTYAIIDDQSNASLISSELLDLFKIKVEAEPYCINSCAGKVMTAGRRADGFIVTSLCGKERLALPTLIECDMIPNNRNEIPTPEVAARYPHLKSIAGKLPELDSKAKISLLIGRDLTPAHYVLDQKIGQAGQPYAQRLKLGWVIIGETCLDGQHLPHDLNSMKTHTQFNGRPTALDPCDSYLHVDSVFRTTKDDNKPSLSIEDQHFLDLMDREMTRDKNHNWVAPLPFKHSRPPLPNNRHQAMDRARNFDISLRKDPVKHRHALEFMQALLKNGHAEIAPEPELNREYWYLPIFGVYHPQKKDRIRMVFDSSAKCQGISLNDVLMTGPNLMNNLVGVLMRFRLEKIAVIADLQQMFYSFLVHPSHRDYLRFVWYEDNDTTKPLVDYRMKVHVFGNGPSPAVAALGLRKTADIAEKTVGADVKEYIYKNFYVDDALSSHRSAEEATTLLKKAMKSLQEEGNLRLHKLCSNSGEVLAAFDKDDLAKDLTELDFDYDDLPIQRSLGVSWNLERDTFTFRVTVNEKPFTRRGVLSTINGLYDPLGFAMPVTIAGKLLLREAMNQPLDWDQPLPEEFRSKFQLWKNDLGSLEGVNIPRTYSMDASSDRDLFIFTDASELAIAAVAYIVTVDNSSKHHFGFVLGKTKVAPKHGHTIPRLELCAAVLGTEIYDVIMDELEVEFRQVKFFTDSKVVLGYIGNETKRFYTYVRNRVDRIRKSSSPEQWGYVPTAQNPADEPTRSISAGSLQESKWLNGPSGSFSRQAEESYQEFPLVDPDEDKEIRTLKTDLVDHVAEKTRPLSDHFEKFSTWKSLTRAFHTLIGFVRSKIATKSQSRTPEEDAKLTVIRVVQRDYFSKEIAAIRDKLPLPRSSTILELSPYLDDDGLLRVGGRIRESKLSMLQTNPVIIPKHHISVLIVRHFHEKISHQGRQLTEAAVRSAGFWLIGGRRFVNSCIHHCVICRKLRGRREEQKMADLPFDRLDPAPPFTYIGIDVFGPWTIATRKTRGGEVNSKRWALLFTCLVVRAVHIELLEEMSSSSFINALRRFCAVRGEVKIIHSDQGTNFVGSTKDLNANVIRVDDRPIQRYLIDHSINWVFNPPHASHMGGAWERMIGVARRILDFLLLGVKNLTHDVLATLMAEVSSIVNARPLTPMSYDPECPCPLTPAMLLTIKTDQTVRSFQLDDFNKKDIYKKQWRCVQYLADQFWARWRVEYLPSLQVRSKWKQESKNLQEGDVVLLADKSTYRNEWPVGRIVKAHLSSDNRVRKVDVRVGSDKRTFTRPTSDIVLLCRKDCESE